MRIESLIVLAALLNCVGGLCMGLGCAAPAPMTAGLMLSLGGLVLVIIGCIFAGNAIDSLPGPGGQPAPTE